jgi:pyridoxine 4-dehydrogenase
MLSAFLFSVALVGPRTLGSLSISEAGLGTLNLALDKKQDEDAAGALKASLKAGCNFLDTAEAYGFGNSERLVAWAAKEAGVTIGCGENELIVATKFAPVPWRSGAESVVEACKASAERLGVEQIPLYQIHWPDIIQPFKAIGLERRKDEEFWEGLARCQELGLAANVGVCNYGAGMVQKVHEYLAARGITLASNQINFSLMYRASAAATVKRCEELGVPIIAYFPLANGLLTGRYDADNLPKFPKGLTMKKYVVGDGAEYGRGYTPLLSELRRVAAARGKTVAQVSINYCLCKGHVPIPGCRNAQMAEANMGAMGWRLTGDEVASLEAASDAVGFEFSSGGFRLDEM